MYQQGVELKNLFVAFFLTVYEALLQSIDQDVVLTVIKYNRI